MFPFKKNEQVEPLWPKGQGQARAFGPGVEEEGTGGAGDVQRAGEQP